MHKKTFFLIAVFFLQTISFSQKSFQQDADSIKLYKLSEVVKTATRTNTSTLELASSITVIDSNDIKNKKKTSIYELLKDEYGISLTQQGAYGSLTNVYLRGANPGHTLILLDGVEMNMPNDPANSFDFAFLPVDNIERIEILRGPQSTLYGSDALAGVINILTKKGSGKTKINLNAEGGSYGYYKGAAGLSGSVDILNYSAQISRAKTDGFSSASEEFGNTEKDGYENLVLSSRIGADVSENVKLNLVLRHTQSESDYDQFGGAFGDDPTYIFDLEENALKFDTELSFFKGLWTQTAGVSFLRNVRKYSYDSTVFNPSSSRSIYDGKKLKFEWVNHLNFSNNNILSLGVETEEEKANSEYYIFSSTFPFESIFPSNQSRTTGVFLQGQTKISESLFASAGIRYDDHERFGSATTFKVAPVFIIWETGTKLKGTFGTGFKAPSLFYLFDPAFGNVNLNPEKSKGWDAGFEQFIWNHNLTFGANYFYNSYTDLFGFDSNFRTVNINKASAKGFEVFFKFKPADFIEINSNFTYTDTKDESESSADKNLPLLRRPKNKFFFGVNYNLNEKFNVNVEYIFSGKKEDKDFSTFPAARIELKSYNLLNLALRYEIVEFAEIYTRFENILDEKYQEVFGYATPGRSVYAGLNIRI